VAAAQQLKPGFDAETNAPARGAKIANQLPFLNASPPAQNCNFLLQNRPPPINLF
jgi:hypothetical protein